MHFEEVGFRFDDRRCFENLLFMFVSISRRSIEVSSAAVGESIDLFVVLNTIDEL